MRIEMREYAAELLRFIGKCLASCEGPWSAVTMSSKRRGLRSPCAEEHLVTDGVVDVMDGAFGERPGEALTRCSKVRSSFLLRARESRMILLERTRPVATDHDAKCSASTRGDSLLCIDHWTIAIFILARVWWLFTSSHRSTAWNERAL